MKTKLLALMALLVTGAAQAVSVAPVDLQNPAYLLERLDDPTLKGYLGVDLKHSMKVVGVIDADDSDYSGGVPGTYSLQDSETGKQVVLPAGSVIRDSWAYGAVAGTSGVTLAVGYTGSAAAILAARDVSSLTAGVATAGVAVSPATVISNSTQRGLTATLTGATLLDGKTYIVLDVVKGLQ